MKLIVCEKQVAAKRIAELLSDGKCVSEGKKVPFYSFPGFTVVGLSGHVLRVDFPSEFSSWSKVSLRDLVNAGVIYVPDRVDIISVVKNLAKSADELVIATDFDTEGESIGLEARDIVFGVKKMPVSRMRFSSITKEEIFDSLNNLSVLDVNLADSANARREVDLIWGAVLTRFLSNCVNRLGNSFLSAGRVQSPTLSLIVDKELERLAFVPVPFWNFNASLIKGKSVFSSCFKDDVFDASLRDELSKVKADSALVSKVNVKVSNVPPPAPFNTTSFLREVSRFGFSGVNAMRIAEALYLKGLISYPRTDNEVYPSSINFVKILDSFKGTSYESLLKFLNEGRVPSRGSKESKDHPPIHPTGLRPEGLSRQELKVYDLIVRRFISTFSVEAIEERVRVVLDIGGFDFVANGYRLVDAGWKGVYSFALKEMVILPELMEGERLKVKSIECVSKETSPPNRFGHGSIIKVMSDLNLGTKSTRPEIIKKLMDRYYLFNYRSLIPTPIAIAVSKALNSFADFITEASTTAKLEGDMDGVAEGKLSKDFVVLEARELLSGIVDTLIKNEEGIAGIIREGITESNKAGPCPKCGSDLFVRFGFKGSRFIGCSGYPDCNNSYPLPRLGFVRVNFDSCPECNVKRMVLVRKGKRPFVFCPNIDCRSRDDDEATIKLRQSRDKYLAGLATKKEVPKKSVSKGVKKVVPKKSVSS